MSDVSHICHIHDPHGRYIQLVREYYQYLSKLYTQMYVVVTEKTNWEVIEALERNEVKVVMQDGGAGLKCISDARARSDIKASWWVRSLPVSLPCASVDDHKGFSFRH